MTRIVGEVTPSGTYFRASRSDDHAIVVGPSASSPEAAVRELDQDAGGPQTRARPTMPGEPSFTPHRRVSAIALIALLTSSGCAHLDSFVKKAERVRKEAAALYMAADDLDRDCEKLQEPKPEACKAADRFMDAIQPYADALPEPEMLPPEDPG